MADVDDYLAGLPDTPERRELRRLDGLVHACVPGAGQATSYSMPCYTYRGLPVAAIMLRRNHIAWYPFSGAVLTHIGDELSGYSHSPGTLRFTASAPLPDRLVERLLDIRMRLIDERLGQSS